MVIVSETAGIVKVFKIKGPKLFEREQQIANNIECRRRKEKRRDWGDN